MTSVPQEAHELIEGGEAAKANSAQTIAPVRIAPRPAIVPIATGPRPDATELALSVQPNAISHFIDLEIEARRCGDLDALRFAMVNSSRKIAAFEQAFLLERTAAAGWTVSRASSVAKIDRSTPLVRAIESWARHPSQAAHQQSGEPRQVNLEHHAKELGLETTAFQFPFAFWLPITARDGTILATLLLLKRENWRPQHSALLLPLAGVYGHAWAALAPRTDAPIAQVRRYLSRSRLAIASLIVALLAAFIPVPMSALAPSEIVAAEPMIVTAPIDGVIADILAPPGSWVEKNAPIVTFVDVKLRNDMEVAARTGAVAEARYFKILQSAIATQKDMQDVAIAKADLDVANAELAYASELLARSVIRAERAGLLIYSAKSDWLGKPVALGERLMEIGDPSKSDIRIELPVSDAIALQPGGTVSLFLDGDPLRSIEGTITQTSYRPTLTAEQQLAFRVRAKFADGQARRIGLRGIARLSGEPVSLWFYVFRRPISWLRQRFGL